MKLLYLKLKDKYGFNYLFLSTVLLLYIIVWLCDFNLFKLIWIDFLKVLLFQMIPVLFIIFSLIFIFNILIEKDYIKEKLQNSNSLVKYLYSIIWWILSTWPVYAWYPFLRQLQTYWLTYGHIASFIYARAIKIPFLAIMIIYFWLKFTVIFNLVLLLLAIFIWITINLIFNFLKYENNNS